MLGYTEILFLLQTKVMQYYYQMRFLELQCHRNELAAGFHPMREFKAFPCTSLDARKGMRREGRRREWREGRGGYGKGEGMNDGKEGKKR